jgi:hypothetical protein
MVWRLLSKTKRTQTKRTVEAITPADIRQLKADGIPDPIISAFNSLIIKNWDGNKSVITQEEAAERAKGLFQIGERIDVQDIYDRKWLDVELIFEARGWKVMYHKEMLSPKPAYFVFTRN